MAIAQLSIDLVAKVAQFEADLKRSTAATQSAAREMAAAFNIMKAAAGAFSVVMLVDFAKQFVTSTVNSIDKLNDLADATGTSVENMSALEDAARRTGTSVDVAGDALIKLNKSLGASTIDSDTARALQAIGLSAAQLKKEDPVDALQRVAVALSSFADGPRKAAVVQELFGKQLREVAPLLNDLATIGRRAATVTSDQAKEAEKFNQELANISKNSEDAARTLVSKFLPAMNQVLAGTARGGIKGGIDQLGELIGLSREYYAERWLKGMARDLADVEEQLKNAQTGDLTRQLDVPDLKVKLAAATKRWEDARDAYLKIRGVEGPLPEFRPSQNYGDATKPQVKEFKLDPKLVEAEKEYQKLAASIGQAGEAASAEIVTGEKQSELLKLRAKVLETLTSGQFKFTEAQKASLKASADSLVVLDDEVKLFKTRQEVQRQSLQLSQQQVAAIGSEIQSRVSANEELRNQSAEYGKTAAQIEVLRIARLEDQAVQEELTILGLQNIEGTELETAARQRNVDALRDQVRLRRQLMGQDAEARTSAAAGAQRALDDYLLRVSEAGVSTEQAVSRAMGSLEDNLTAALSGGKADVRAFVNSVLQEMIRLQVVRPLLASIFGGGRSGGGNGFSLYDTNNNNAGFSDITKNFGGTFADGGFLGAGKWGIAGEAGPEPIIGPAQIVSNKSMAQASAPANQFTVVVQGDASENTVRLINAALANFQARQLRGGM